MVVAVDARSFGSTLSKLRSVRVKLFVLRWGVSLLVRGPDLLRYTRDEGSRPEQSLSPLQHGSPPAHRDLPPLLPARRHL